MNGAADAGRQAGGQAGGCVGGGCCASHGSSSTCADLLPAAATVGAATAAAMPEMCKVQHAGGAAEGRPSGWLSEIPTRGVVSVRQNLLSLIRVQSSPRRRCASHASRGATTQPHSIEPVAAGTVHACPARHLPPGIPSASLSGWTGISSWTSAFYAPPRWHRWRPQMGTRSPQSAAPAQTSRAAARPASPPRPPSAGRWWRCCSTACRGTGAGGLRCRSTG